MEVPKLIKYLMNVSDKKTKAIVNRLHINEDPTKELSPYKLGSGSRSSVFAIQDKKTKAWYAMKAVDGDIADYENMCGRPGLDGKKKDGEVDVYRALKSINGFVQLVDGPYDLAENVCFILLEKGDRNLEDVIEAGHKFGGTPMSTEAITSIANSLCSALDEAHKLKDPIYHRDLKASNVIMFGETPKWGDLSEAGFLGSGSTVTLKGTKKNLAPEVLTDPLKAKEEPAEIYSIGCLLYHMMMGSQLYEEVNVAKLVDLANDPYGSLALQGLKIKKEDLEKRLKRLDGTSYPQYLRTIVRKCLEPMPEDRYQTTQELIDALGCYGDYRKSYDSMLAECKKTWTEPLAPVDLVRETKQAYAQLMASYEQSGLAGDEEAKKLLAKAEKEYKAFEGRVMKGVDVYFPIDSSEPNALEKTKQHLGKMVANGGITPQSLAEIRNQCLDITDILGT